MLLSACGADASDGRPDRDASVLLDAAPNGVHAGIYTAIARGYDEAEGVRLKVRAPGSPAEPASALEAGDVDFAVLDLHDLALAREHGHDLVGVMSIAQRPLAAVLAQPGIRSPRALEEHRVRVTSRAADDAVLDAVVAGDGGDPARVRRTSAGASAVAALVAGKAAGATGFWDTDGLRLAAKEPGATAFHVEDYGAPVYPELVLAVNRDTLDDAPDLVRATVAALRRGYQFTLNDGDSSASDVAAEVPAADRTRILDQINVLTEVFLGPTNTPGGLDRAVLERWATWERRIGVTKVAPNVAEAFDFTDANRKMASDTTF